jgi:hypothetical protein
MVTRLSEAARHAAVLLEYILPKSPWLSVCHRICVLKLDSIELDTIESNSGSEMTCYQETVA